MKNTALIFTLSTIVTQIVLMIIFAVSYQFFYNLYITFWTMSLNINILGWISIVIISASLILAFFFAYKKNTIVSYALAIVAGIFLGISLYMVSIMVID